MSLQLRVQVQIPVQSKLILGVRYRKSFLIPNAILSALVTALTSVDPVT